MYDRLMEEPSIYFVPEQRKWVCVCRLARGEGATRDAARTAWAEWYDRTLSALRGRPYEAGKPRVTKRRAFRPNRDAAGRFDPY